ncbi:plasma membrane potassium ion transmembrane transporter Trk1 [Schizosaccharomyces osmophilus]|uniref:Potassium transport protein n=1 Tax=Schizosaccharomyces osmophilus TaxID=2545709 RepID=A0AAF0AW29_9SCHI|nr:plasma membrane potassium ion transmembrane transporter Trk1 [Schizosaccharomyces osmophilus]WBW73053.1 plasma membrane potassium ion transmembrane transporter Trk1 [Schizosaccharomyces osmophilus]
MFTKARKWIQWIVPNFGFLAIHYSYIIVLVIICSILLFTGGAKIAYIDALFLASSSVTQTGLNTVNLIDLTTWQQFVIFFFPIVSVPIWMHGAISFVRLYWFRRKCRYVIRQNRTRRFQRNVRRKQLKQEKKNEKQGVRGRKIQVLLPHQANDDSDPAPTFGNPDITSTEYPQEDPSSNPVPISPKAIPKEPETDTRTTLSIQELSDIDLEDPETNNTVDPSSNLPSKKFDVDEEIEMDDLHPRLRRQNSVITAFLNNNDDVHETQSYSEKGIPPVPMPYCLSDTNLLNLQDTPVGSSLPTSNNKASITIYEPKKNTYSTSVSSESENHSQEDVHIAFTNLHKPTLERKRQEDLVENKKFFQKKPTRFRRMSAPMRWTKSLSVNPRSLTLERVLSSAFGRRREGTNSSSRSTVMSLPYLSYNPTVDRNSAFVELSREQRDELGGIEYRALKCVCTVVSIYFILTNIFAIVIFIVFSYTAHGSYLIIDSLGLKRGWWALFTSVSSFNDLGYSLVPASFSPFNKNIFLLLISSLFIIAGNTGFPVFLRLFIWFFYKILPLGQEKKEAMAFLLDHPRRCFTLLFPSGSTWWLFFILLGLNAIDLILFMSLDIKNESIVGLPRGMRVVNALFQSVCTRTAGFTSITLSALHPAVLVSYLIMMYISVYPVAINMRNTNVYEERSLGVYTFDEEEHKSFLKNHLTEQVSHDLWCIFLGLFIICICEGGKIANNNDTDFTIFAVLFEIVSAYGTVGLSTGLSTSACSLSARFTKLSKLVIIALQIRGRHRGLPRAVDRAILLPTEKNNLKEEEDHRRRQELSRTISYSRASVSIHRDE